MGIFDPSSGMTLQQRAAGLRARSVQDPPRDQRPRRTILRMSRWVFWSIASLVLVLLILRLLAPTLIRHELVKRINDSPGYHGSIGSVHLHLWRGAYDIRDIEIARTDEPQLPPVLTCHRVEFSVAWRPLLHGELVASVSLMAPDIHYAVNGQQRQLPTPTSPLGGKKGETVPWQEHLQSLFPISIDQVTVKDGGISYQDQGKDLDLSIGKMQGRIDNLTNNARVSKAGNRTATIALDGRLLGGGDLSLNGSVDPYVQPLTMQMRLAILHMDLVPFNPAFMKYEGITLKHGTLDFFLEAHIDAGHLTGYAKPLLTNCSIYSPKDLQKHGIKVWKEALAGLADHLLKNQDKDSLATDVPLVGDFNNPKVGFGPTIIGILKNGFIRALLPQFDRWRQHQGDHHEDGQHQGEQHQGA